MLHTVRTQTHKRILSTKGQKTVQAQVAIMSTRTGRI